MMGVDRQILESTGWALWFDVSQIVYIFAGIVAVLALAANNWWIPLRAEKAAAMAESELKAQPVFAWSRRLLLEDKWEQVDDGGELTFFIKHPTQTLDETRTTSVVVKEGETTLSWINIVALASNNVWPIGAYQELEDGKNPLSVFEAVAGTGIADIIRSTGSVPIEIIGVGLESSYGGDDEDTHRRLSIRRGTELVRACHRSLTVLDPTRRISYRTLGLGRARDFAAKDTDIERRQRSALVIVVASMQSTPALLSVDETLAALVMNVEVVGVDLSRYEYSSLADVRLSPSLKFDGDVTPLWNVVDISAEEAIEENN